VKATFLQELCQEGGGAPITLCDLFRLNLWRLTLKNVDEIHEILSFFPIIAQFSCLCKPGISGHPGETASVCIVPHFVHAIAPKSGEGKRICA
jgi:hypothetical protein